jgi:hypothetical protein
MSKHRQIENPSPTIVGARPAAGSRDKMDVPQGIERLLILSGSSGKWKQKVLADPFGAAREAQIELSLSERSILESLPRNALAQMARSFEKRAASGPLMRLAGAATVATAALLSGTRTFAEETPVKPKPDAPARDKEAAIVWAETFADALAQAKQTNRAIMLVFPHSDVDSTGDQPRRTDEVPMAVAGARARIESKEQKSQRVVLSKSKTFAAAANSTELVAVKVSWPERPAKALGGADEEKLQQAVKDYWALLKKYDIEGKVPAVVFAAPDGSLLSKSVQPETEPLLVNEIKAVPALLEKWLAGKGDAVPKPDPQPLDTRPEQPKKD